MRITLLITMYNEIDYGPHVYVQLDNALEMDCYDNIVVLDDGSTDGTWEVINSYANKHSHIRVVKSAKNSILYGSVNRWKRIMWVVRSLDPSPTWVNVRAADVIYPAHLGSLFRKQLELLHSEGINLVWVPLINLWRSKYWYRVDGPFGRLANTHSINPIWVFDQGYRYGKEQEKAGYHQGNHIPLELGFEPKRGNINLSLGRPFPIVALHLGSSTHERKVTKFRQSMEFAKIANKENLCINMPSPENMPPIIEWPNYNSYRGFYEFDIELEKVSQIWYKDKIPDEQKPVPKSMYDVIKEYNDERAEEYKVLYNKWVKENS